MRPPPDINTASLALSTLVVLVAAGLAWFEWRGHRARGTGLSLEDARHFRRQGARRGVGLLILLALAVGLVVGSRIPIRAGMHANPNFVAAWLAIFALILALLWLAMADWVALRRFAGRHRKAIFRERIDLLRRDLAERDRDGQDPDFD